jgi:flagellar hook-associated protein 2
VTATVVDTGDTANPFKLVVSSQQSGTQYAFTLTETTGSGALNSLINEVSGNIVVGAADADLTVNGVRVTRSSNVITDVVSGVTLELTGVHTVANTDSVLTVTPDSTAVKEKVSKFIEAYNAVVEFVKKQFTVDSQGKASSPVFGDSTLRSIRSELRTIVGESVDSGNPSYNLLAQVGITADRDGLLTLAEDKFKTAIETDDEAVENLFAMTGAGIARKVFDKTESWLNIVDGPLQLRKKGFDTRTKNIDDQIRTMEARVKDFETRLTMRFANAELAIGRLKAQGNSLGIQF